MLRNGVMPMPPAIHTCRELARARWEKVPYGPSSSADPPGGRSISTLVWSPRAFTTSRNAASSGAEVIENEWASPPSSANRTNTN